MDFKAVDGSYVLNKGVVKKVPATDAEALTTDLVGFFEKRRLRSFFMYAQEPTFTPIHLFAMRPVPWRVEHINMCLALGMLTSAIMPVCMVQRRIR
jgi:hypothetical protein